MACRINMSSLTSWTAWSIYPIMSRNGLQEQVLSPDDLQLNDDYISTSGIIDINNILQPANAATLRRLSCLIDDNTVNVMYGSNLKSHWEDPAYFTSASPTLFPYGTGKRIDSRRSKHLSLKVWTSLLLKHCSQYVHSCFTITYI